MKILMVASSLHNGAVSCRSVAREMSASARRVKGMPAPPGLPPELAGELHACAVQLQRSAIAAEREAIFLQIRAHRGLLADGPLGSPIGDLLSPPLLSPWNMPDDPSEHHPLNIVADVRKGIRDELATAAVSTWDLAVGLVGNVLNSRGGGVSKHLPYVEKRRRALQDAAEYIARHPGEFAVSVVKDAVAYNTWTKRHYGEAVGHNIVGVVGFLAPMSKAAQAARAGRIAEEAGRVERGAAITENYARLDRNIARAKRDMDSGAGRRPGETLAQRHDRADALKARVDAANEHLGQAREQLHAEAERARAAEAHAADARQEAQADARREAAQSGAISANNAAHAEGHEKP